MLIAAQAIEEAAAIVALNEKHFERLVDALSWTAGPARGYLMGGAEDAHLAHRVRVAEQPAEDQE